jgi:hypothetical protein
MLTLIDAWNETCVMTYYWHKHMFLCLRHNAINIALFVGSSDLYLEDEDEEFGRFNGQHEYIVLNLDTR